MRKPNSTLFSSSLCNAHSVFRRMCLVALPLLLTVFLANTLHAQCGLSCSNKNVSLDQDCSYALNASEVATWTSSCAGPFLIKITNLDETQEIYPASASPLTIYGDDFDLCGSTQYKVHIIDQSSGNRCWSLLRVEDKYAPVINCNEAIIGGIPVTTDTVPCTYSRADLSGLVGRPDAIDNCDDNLTYVYANEQYLDLGCNDLTFGTSFSAVLIRDVYVYDHCGNGDTCKQYLFVERAPQNLVYCPPHWDGLAGNNPAFECIGNGHLLNTINTYCGDNTIGDETSELDANGHPSPACTGAPYIDGNGNGSFDTGESLWPSNTGLCEINAGYTDQIIPICPASGGNTTSNAYKILRTWTVLNWCTGETTPCLQIIKVHDTTPPVINVTAPAIFGTVAGQCYGTVTLPAATVSDACDPSVQVSATFLGNTYTSFPRTVTQIPAGTYTVTYTATDDCGNTATRSITIVVADDDAPVAVCKEFITVGLAADQNAQQCYGGSTSSTATGETIVCWDSFDAGSYDNCSDVTILIKRMNDGPGVPFTPCITVSCSDIGNPVQVRLRAYDLLTNDVATYQYEDQGRYNECMANATVQDKTAPTITCPPNKVLDCGQDPFELGLTGVACATDNCSVTITTSTSGSLNDCGTGTIYRTWTATDGAGLTATCTQRIDVVNQDPFSSDDINWPEDVVITNCAGGTEPDQIESVYPGRGIVRYNADECAHIAVTHEDLVLPIQPPACLKILRKWYVLDWCQYNSTNQAGLWSYTQTIKVQNTVAPVITCPSDTLIYAANANCDAFINRPVTATDDCTPASELSYTYYVDLFNNGSTDYTGHTPSASGTYPTGTHKFTYVVEDGCGNRDTCFYRVTIVDGKKPVPVCYFGLSVELNPMDTDNDGVVDTAMSTLWAIDFLNENSSYDNCSGIDLDDVRVRQIETLGGGPNTPPSAGSTNVVFSCEDIGTQFLQIWVRDNSGNWDYCEAYVFVQAHMGGCAFVGEASAQVSGNIHNEEGENVEDVTIQTAQGASSPIPSFLTQANGQFAFNLFVDNAYTVRPEKLMDPLNGVTTFDLVLINKHILGLQLLDSPYKMIAADINKSGSITTFDMVELRKLILQIYSAYPANTSWRFVDASYTFPNPANPFTQTFPEVYDINNLTQEGMNMNFVGVKVGDVNNSAQASNLLGSEDRNANGSLKLQVKDQTVNAGETFTVNFTAKDFTNIAGYQFTLNFDTRALELADVKAGELAGLTTDNFGFTYAAEGAITTSWNNFNTTTLKDDAVLFSVTFNSKANAQLSKVMSLSSRYTVAEAYKGDSTIENLDVALQFNSNTTATLATEGFELYQNAPNPFKG
ncbi:MAG: cohesin domain-containing protein, partial [Saprospiraceae bacterium]